MPAATRNRKTAEFHEQFQRLPSQIQEVARAAFEAFLLNPNHPSLRLHSLTASHRAKHVSGSFSVSITMKYRAIFVVYKNENVWYWIGTHAEYNHFTGRNR